MNKRAIVSMANERGRYIQNLMRLEQSLNGNFNGEFIGFIGEESCGAEPHECNPYSFKIHCISKVLQLGFSQILWLDSSCFSIKNVSPIFDAIENDGYIMQEAGHWVGNWTNDKTLEYFGTSRDEAMLMPCYGNAGFLGLNFATEIAQEFFKQWSASMEAGMFKGSWTNAENTESFDERCNGHRHDLSCGSIIANKLGMRYKKGNEWLQYAGIEDEVLNDTIILKAQG